MADTQKQFQVNITGKDETAGAFAAVEASFRQLGMTAEQVQVELKHLQGVAENDAMAQHIRGAEVELRRLGLTSTAVQAEMERLNKFKPSPVEFEMAEAATAHIGRYERVMNWFDSRGRKGEGEHEGGEKHGESHEGGEHEHHGHGWEGINTHINILRTHFGELNENIGETRESLTEMLPMLAGFGAVGSIAGMVELVHATAEEQAQLEAMSKQLGITANQLENFHYAANIADVPVDAMDKAIGRLGISMADAASGHNKLDAAIFKKMGISLKDARGHMEPIPKVLGEISQALKNTADPAMRLYVAQELFGRSGREMLPLLIQGRERFEDLNEEAEKLGPQLTDLDRDHLEQFNDAWKQAQYVSESFMTKLGADLAPVMTPLLDDFTQFVALNKDWIAADAAGAAKHFADAMKQFPWGTALKGAEGFAKDVGSVASDINSVVTQIPGGWKTVIELFAAYKLASPFAHMIADGMRVLKIGAGMVDIVGKQLPAALKLADVAWGAFSDAGVAAFTKISAAEAAANQAFVKTPLGRALAVSFAVADAAQKMGNQPIHLNAAQEAYHKSLHLAPGQAPTADEIAHMNALGGAGAPSVTDVYGPHADVVSDAVSLAKRWLGIKDAETAPVVSPYSDRPRGPIGRFVSPDQPIPGTGVAAPMLPGARDSNVTVHVQFDNAPPGMTVTQSTSDNVRTSVDVGYNKLVPLVGMW